MASVALPLLRVTLLPDLTTGLILRPRQSPGLADIPAESGPHGQRADHPLSRSDAPLDSSPHGTG